MQVINISNEAKVVVEGLEMMVLVNTRSQVLNLTEGFYLEFGFRVLTLRGLLCLEGTEGIWIPYKGYIEE